MGDLQSRRPADRRIRGFGSTWRSAVDTLISCGLPAVSRTTEIGIDGIVGFRSGPGLRVMENGSRLTSTERSATPSTFHRKSSKHVPELNGNEFTGAT